MIEQIIIGMKSNPQYGFSEISQLHKLLDKYDPTFCFPLISQEPFSTCLPTALSDLIFRIQIKQSRIYSMKALNKMGGKGYLYLDSINDIPHLQSDKVNNI